MICKGCLKEQKLVRTHVIPESFFRDLRAEESTLKLVSNIEGSYTKKAPIGVYDMNILCRSCEDRFQVVDDYAAKVLIQRKDFKQLKHYGRTVGFELDGIDYSLLKLFVISVLWRASISKEEFYRKVNLGALEESAKSLIWDKSSGSRHEFSFVLARFIDGGTISKALLDPHQEKWFDRRYYRFYMGGYVLHVKADSQTTPKEWARFISENETLTIISRGKIQNSKEYPVLKNGVLEDLKK